MRQVNMKGWATHPHCDVNKGCRTEAPSNSLEWTTRSGSLIVFLLNTGGLPFFPLMRREKKSAGQSHTRNSLKITAKLNCRLFFHGHILNVYYVRWLLEKWQVSVFIRLPKCMDLTDSLSETWRNFQLQGFHRNVSPLLGRHSSSRSSHRSQKPTFQTLC